MKPSDAGTTSTKLTYVRNSKLNTFGDVEAKKTVKSRYPMTYSKKELVRIGMGSYYKNHAYQARVSEASFPLVKRTTFMFKGKELDYYSERFGRCVSAEFLTCPNWVTLLEANAYNQTIVDFLNKIQARKVSLLEEHKMFRKNIQTIATSAERMVQHAKNMFANPYKWLRSAHRKGGRRVGYRKIRSYGDLWLEGRYHWMPIYLTMQKAFIALQDMHPGMEIFHKGPKFKATYAIDEAPITGFFPNGVHWDCQCDTTFKMGCRITARSEAAMLAKRYGAGGFADLTAFKWETSPWTLVFDWVIPVSNVLLAHTALDGIVAHNPWQTRKRLLSGSVANISTSSSSSTQTFKVIQNGEINIEEYERTTTPITALDPNIFIADEVVKPQRIIDALSFLTGSRFGKRVISGQK